MESMSEPKPIDESGHFEGYEDGVLRIAIPENDSGQAYRIVHEIVPEVVKLFVQKNADYGDTSFDLGIKGQYAELHRKIGKLKRTMWDGNGLKFEQTEEVLMDLIGHALLSLYFLQEEDQKAKSAWWSNNLKELDKADEVAGNHQVKGDD